MLPTTVEMPSRIDQNAPLSIKSAIPASPRGYSHILVPTAISPAESPAVALGRQLAESQRAQLTLLHVIPDEPVAAESNETPSPTHWLDAIDALHKSLSPAIRAAQVKSRLQALEEARSKLSAYLERHCPLNEGRDGEIRLECREGDVAGEILRYCREESVDLVILTSGLSRWTLPLVPARVHQVLQQSRHPVIVVRPPATAAVNGSR